MKDPQQAEELAHILKTVRLRLGERGCAGPSGPVVGFARDEHLSLRTTPSTRPLFRSAPHPRARQVHWKNSLALWMLPRRVAQLPLFLQSWLANGILCYFEYFLSGSLWALWVYKCAP